MHKIQHFTTLASDTLSKSSTPMSSLSSFLHDGALYMELQVGMTITPRAGKHWTHGCLGVWVRDGVGLVAGVIFHPWGPKCMFFLFFSSNWVGCVCRCGCEIAHSSLIEGGRR